MMGNLLFLGLVGLISAIAFWFLPSSLDPVLWSNPFPLPSLDGPMTPNSILKGTDKHGYNEITAPESMAMDPSTGNVFLSLNDGRVVLLDKQGSYVSDIYFNGMLSKDISNNASLSNLLDWCKGGARAGELAWHVEEEKMCGRPLGLRWRKGGDGQQSALYLLDAYHGLFTIHFDEDMTRPTTISHEITPQTKISTPKDIAVDPIAVLPPKFYNDLDVLSDGRVVFSDSSYRYHRSQNRQEVLDGSPRGRFFLFEPSNKRLTVLACGLHFPNGVQLQDSSNALLIESTRFRILSMNLDALQQSNDLLLSCDEDGSLSKALENNASGISVFLDRGPGFMDNIRRLSTSTDSDPHYLIGVGTKSTKPFSLLYIAYQGTLLRHIIGRVMPMRYVEKLLPKYGLVIQVDGEGKIVESMHDPSGTIAFVSEAQVNPVTGDLWLGSHSNPYVGILPQINMKKSDS